MHLKAADGELGLFDQTRQHRGVNRVNVQHGVGFREQAINQRVQTGLRRRFTTGRRAVGGDLHLQKVIGCEATFVLAGFAEPAEMFVLTHRHVTAGSGRPAFGTDPAAGVDQMRELQVVCHFPFTLSARNIHMVYTRHTSSCRCVGCTHSPQSRTYVRSRGFVPLPPSCNSNYLGYRRLSVLIAKD